MIIPKNWDKKTLYIKTKITVKRTRGIELKAMPINSCNSVSYIL